MNPLLERKLNELKSAQDYECWYLVKHSTNFAHLCYLVTFLKDYKDNPGVSVNLEEHISKKVSLINSVKPNLRLSDNYRALRVAAFFGLIKMTSSKYDECIFTDTYYEILNRCSGDFEKTELYQDIITRQIEKMYISSSIDEGKANVRREYAIFPIMFLNKILLELGKATGSYSITMNEYRYLVATTKKYSDFLETMLYIKLLREEGDQTYNNGISVIEEFKTLRDKFDNRMNKAIELLEYIDSSNDKLTLKEEYIPLISKKVYEFESKNYNLSDSEYIDFLCSTKSLFSDDTKKTSKILTPEWFKEKGEEFTGDDLEAQRIYVSFNENYGIDKLSTYSGEELLNALFLGGNSDNLCHELEYVKRNTDLFGSIKNGNAFKYPLFKRNGTWMTGTARNPKELQLDEAIIIGVKVRDGLVNAVKAIKESLPLESVEQYLSLYSKLFTIIPEYVDSLWVTKYFHMIFPDLFPVFYNRDWQLKVLSLLNITPSETSYGRLGQINEFVRRCEISNVVFAKVFHKYCKNTIFDEDQDVIFDDVEVDRLTGGTNIILYGVPGAGKSWTIKNEYCDDDDRIERLVFHPDYTYSDFVGQILPRLDDDGSVSYKFTPGPFTKLLRKSFINPNKMFYLIIEEVNRGNAPAIFGDIFQLLDRNKDGSSEYEITNSDIAKIVYGNENHKVSIPSNMSILCTMNTSDQNVFTLDTAFQRRWSMRLIKNKFKEGKESELANARILDTTVTWEKFFSEINNIILQKNIRMTSSEDKRLGTHFVSIEDLKYIQGDEKQNSRFPEKVLKYLWDDAFKFTKEDIFDLDNVRSLEDVIEHFLSAKGDERFKVFKENIYNTLVRN
jgi:MoxR-like ATPase